MLVQRRFLARQNRNKYYLNEGFAREWIDDFSPVIVLVVFKIVSAIMPRAFAEDGSQDVIDSTTRIAKPNFIIEAVFISEKYGVLIMCLFPEEREFKWRIHAIGEVFVFLI